MLRRLGSFSLILLLLILTGCAGMNRTQQRALSGAAIGTGVGTAAAAITGGSLATGAVAGAAAGTLGGLIVDGLDKKRR
jgi:hypothetical protein